eukprot:1188196-Rhodomonas_salina.1
MPSPGPVNFTGDVATSRPMELGPIMICEFRFFDPQATSLTLRTHRGLRVTKLLRLTILCAARLSACGWPRRVPLLACSARTVSIASLRLRAIPQCWLLFFPATGSNLKSSLPGLESYQCELDALPLAGRASAAAQAPISPGGGSPWAVAP